jgi:hypothetical protein
MRATCTRCRHCSAPVLAGYDDHGFWVRVDLVEVDAAGEMIARLTGRLSYVLSSGQLVRRTHWAIKAQRQRGVLVEHSCGQPIPGKALARRQQLVEADDAPPF